MNSFHGRRKNCRRFHLAAAQNFNHPIEINGAKLLFGLEYIMKTFTLLINFFRFPFYEYYKNVSFYLLYEFDPKL